MTDLSIEEARKFMLIESSRDTWPLTKYPYGIAYLRYLYNDAFTAASIAI